MPDPNDSPAQGSTASAFEKATAAANAAARWTPQQLQNVLLAALVISLIVFLGFRLYKEDESKQAERVSGAERDALIIRSGAEREERDRLFHTAEAERSRMFYASEREKDRRELLAIRETWVLLTARWNEIEKMLRRIPGVDMFEALYKAFRAPWAGAAG